MSTTGTPSTVNDNSVWKAIVIGLTDGIIISLALNTALSVVFKTRDVVVNTGLIAAIIGAIVISIGGYFAARYRMESLSLKSEEEEKKLHAEETARTISLFKKLNLGNDMQEQAAYEIEKGSAEWKAFLQQNQQSLEVPDKSKLPVTAIIIGLSYLVAALVPLVPFIIIDAIDKALTYSIIVSLIVLPITGYIKSRINGENALWGLARLLILGVSAVAAVWFVAKIFAS